MKQQPSRYDLSAIKYRSITKFIGIALLPYLLLLVIQNTRAGSATWNLSPGSGLWNTATNWTPATVPNGPDDIATFGVSNITGIGNDTLHDIEVNGIVFSAGASAFTITFGNSSFFEDYRISGVGITNNSGLTQHFAIGDFGDSATLLSQTARPQETTPFLPPAPTAAARATTCSKTPRRPATLR